MPCLWLACFALWVSPGEVIADGEAQNFKTEPLTVADHDTRKMGSFDNPFGVAGVIL